MKYSYPRIDTSLLKKAANIFNQGIIEYKARGLKKESDLVEAIFKIMNRFFSQFRTPSLSKNMRVKSDPPRTAALSSEYNKFIRALSTDLYGSYSDQKDIDKAINLHFNYAQANRLGFDNTIKQVNEVVTDFAVVSQSTDTRDVWFKDSFNTDSRVDSKYTGYSTSPGIVNIVDGVFELSASDSADVLTPDNIEDIDDAHISIDDGFEYSAPYRGRRYGVISEDSSSDEQPRPDTDKSGSSWTSRSVRNLVDPDEVDSSWEVEVTAREGMSDRDYNKTNAGPYFFLHDSGEPDKISLLENNSVVYKYSKGYLCYFDRAYESTFFRNTNGKPVNRLVSAQLVITLKEPQYISSIRMTRKPVNSKTVDGQDHIIYVSNIETRNITDTLGTTSDWVPIPSFNQLETYRTSNNTTKKATGWWTKTKVTSILSTAQAERNDLIKVGVTPTGRGTRVTEEVSIASGQRARIRNRGTATNTVQDEKPNSLYRGAEYNKPTTTEPTIWDYAVTPTPSYEGAQSHYHISDILKPSDSQFSRASSWKFPTRLVKSIRILLYTDMPYLIRYSMGKYTIGDKEKTSSTFVQYGEIDNPSSVNTGIEDQSSRLKAIVTAMINNIASVYKINLTDSRLAGAKIFNAKPEVHTIISKDDSDVYRWSIGLSDISASTSLYGNEGELVSTIYNIDNPVDRIVLYTNHELNGGSIEYYIIPEGGSPYRINPWEEKDIKLVDGRFIPKMLYVNSEIPQDRRDKTRWGNYAYIDTPTPLYGFRVRAILTRGGDPNRCPFIRDYKVRVVPKDIGGNVVHVS